MAKKDEKPSLFELALKALGLLADHVLAKREEKDRVVIVTHGGFKREFREGRDVEPLTFAQKTGELRK